MYFSVLNERINTTFLVIIALAALVLFVPRERLTSIKAVGIELTLSQPQLKGAMDGFLDVDNKKIK